MRNKDPCVLANLPIDFHCHGVGPFDFGKPPDLVLYDIEEALALESIRAVLTVYLPESLLTRFERFMKSYAQMHAQGLLSHVCGIAIEGPLLASTGGTPKSATWQPTKSQWETLAALGEFGLQYIVISPDADGVPLNSAPADYPTDILWIAATLCNSGIRPALGHFRKDDPYGTAKRIKSVLQVAKEQDYIFVTDHMFNDMPLRFHKAWRTAGEKARRDEELEHARLSEWSVETAEHLLGPVPTALIEGAHQGLLKICINFDGDHVDLAVCKRAVELIGSENMMVMTDRIQGDLLGGQRLHREPGNTLKYQSNGIVAGGTQSLAHHILNMRRCGLSAKDIENLTLNTPIQLLRT